MADPITDAAKAEKLRIRKDAFNAATDILADNLMSGKITLGMYEEDFRTRLREYLVGAAMIGKGDPTKMTPSDWGKAGAQLKKQYQWLHGFTQDIFDNKDTVTLAAIKARAHLYGEAGGVVANEAQAGYFAPNTRRDPPIILPWIPKDGSTECLNRCLCTWIMAEGDVTDGIKDVTATWTLHPAEHCETCVSRDGHVEFVQVPASVDVPPFIGLGGA
jgi:hypothetical protein